MNQAIQPLSLVANAEPVVSANAFRGAMRLLPGGVSVITAGRGRDITGMTVTSVSALAIEPATIIVSVNRQSSSFPVLRKDGRFGVNFLGDTQKDVAERFTGKGGLKGADRFLGVAWQPAASGVPLLLHALAALDCAVEEIVERHSHAIVIGAVRDIRYSDTLDALTYWQGDYVALKRTPENVRAAQPVPFL